MNTGLAGDEVFCRDCGEVISARAEICPECGIRQKEPEPTSPEKSPGLAAVASFFVPGLGQIYNGEIAKGLVLMVVTLGLAITIVGLVLAFPLWIWLIYDAYKVAERGGAPTSTGGSGSLPPRTAIEQALSKRIEEADDPTEAKAVRKRFRGTKTSKLSESDKEFILETLGEYRPSSVPAVREEFGR